MGRLKDLWSEYRTIDKSSQRAKEIRNKINEIEKWMVDKGYRKKDEITKWYDQDQMIVNEKVGNSFLDKPDGYYCATHELMLDPNSLNEGICSECMKIELDLNRRGIFLKGLLGHPAAVYINAKVDENG